MSVRVPGGADYLSDVPCERERVRTRGRVESKRMNGGQRSELGVWKNRGYGRG